MAATGVKDHRNLLVAPVTAFATFAITPDFNVLALDFRMFSDPHRVGGGVWRYRVHRARNHRPAVVGLEALHAVVFGNEC